MNLKHLGDAFDHWKGSVLNSFPSPNLQVVPMFTDGPKWFPNHLTTYAKLLHRSPKDIWKPRCRFTNKTRGKYFDGLGHADLFLDPDTGIATGKLAKETHLKVSEIAELLEESSGRILIIYQHSSRKKDWLKKKLRALRTAAGLKSSHLIAYDSGAVSLVIVSMNAVRITEVKRCLTRSLGPVSWRRIVT